jgi:hypothetical protein
MPGDQKGVISSNAAVVDLSIDDYGINLDCFRVADKLAESKGHQSRFSSRREHPVGQASLTTAATC